MVLGLILLVVALYSAYLASERHARRAVADRIEGMPWHDPPAAVAGLRNLASHHKQQIVCTQLLSFAKITGAKRCLPAIAALLDCRQEIESIHLAEALGRCVSLALRETAKSQRLDFEHLGNEMHLCEEHLGAAPQPIPDLTNFRKFESCSRVQTFLSTVRAILAPINTVEQAPAAQSQPSHAPRVKLPNADAHSFIHLAILGNLSLSFDRLLRERLQERAATTCLHSARGFEVCAASAVAGLMASVLAVLINHAGEPVFDNKAPLYTRKDSVALSDSLKRCKGRGRATLVFASTSFKICLK